MTHPDLDQLVALARRDRPAAGVLAALARSLRVPFVAAPIAAVVVPSTAAAGVVAKAGLSRLALLGWGAGGTVAASGVALAVAFSQPSAPSSPTTTVRPPVVQPASTPKPVQVAEPTPEPEAAATPAAPIRPAKEAPTVWDEPQLIEKARKALATDPRRALSLTQEHQRRFPAGALGVEREVIALEALSRVGQTAEAKRRALAFQAKYPSSIHAPRVHALLVRLGAK